MNTQKRRILIVDSHAELAALLADALVELGHDVVMTNNRDEALKRSDLSSFNLIISDLTDESDSQSHIVEELKRQNLPVPVVVSSEQAHAPKLTKAFKMGAANFLRRPYDTRELAIIIEKTLSYKLRFIEDLKVLPYTRERIEFELPSDLTLMNGVLHYLIERVARLGVIQPERSNLFVALDEAFVNAVKHGNQNDPEKLVRITAELSVEEARFTVEDEGTGFDINQIPDPRDPANLFKSSGRGVLLIHGIMDEVEYNERGNRVTMVKRNEHTLEADLINSIHPPDNSSNK